MAYRLCIVTFHDIDAMHTLRSFLVLVFSHEQLKFRGFVAHQWYVKGSYLYLRERCSTCAQLGLGLRPLPSILVPQSCALLEVCTKVRTLRL